MGSSILVRLMRGPPHVVHAGAWCPRLWLRYLTTAPPPIPIRVPAPIQSFRFTYSREAPGGRMLRAGRLAGVSAATASTPTCTPGSRREPVSPVAATCPSSRAPTLSVSKPGADSFFFPPRQSAQCRQGRRYSLDRYEALVEPEYIPSQLLHVLVCYTGTSHAYTPRTVSGTLLD